MRAFNHLYVACADAPADPCLHGIARGLGLLFQPPAIDDLPEQMTDLIARLTLRDEWDGPDRCDDWRATPRGLLGPKSSL